MKSAMITIEVLVSMLILFLIMTTSFSNINFFNIMIKKKQNYEDEYMTVLSLKDKLSFSICKTSLVEEGSFNNFNYKATCQKVKELRTFIKAIEPDDPHGNIGNNLVILYEVNIELDNKLFKSKNSYYIMRNQ